MNRASLALPLRIALALTLAGCGHDWSAADTSDVEDAPDAVDGDVPSDDGTGEIRPEAEDGDVPADDVAEATDEAAVDVPACDPSEDHCTDGRLRRCRADGSGWDETFCHFGCAADEARCLQLAPANVTDDALLDTGLTPLEIPALGVVVFHTASGSITLYDSSGAEHELRPGGTGTLAGIPFVRQDQADGLPGLGIWTLARLTVGTGALVYGKGPNSMVLLVNGDALLDGLVDVGGVPEGFGGGTGPGAAEGGPGETTGLGMGGGRPGRGLGFVEDSGGGGAGFGGRGGRGGDCSMSPGGDGGSVWGTSELVPLVGGSGGGGGGDEGAGGRGGDGGGAFQLSAAGRIVVATGGGITAGGRGGQGGQAADGAGGGGGGGGSGGAVLLEAAEITLHGGVAANGGGGGAGAFGTTRPGADGASGAFAPSPAAAGGSGAGDGSSGGHGSDALVTAGAPGVAVPVLSLDDAGGGGGGAGRIRLQAPTLTIDGFLSPAETTGLATRGTCATR